MLSSGILDLALGLIFTFLAVSLAAGSVTEILSSILKWRAHTLYQGIKDLLNDPNFDALAREVYKHGLINPLGDGTNASSASWRARWVNGPAYIEPDQFAAALLDILKIHNDAPGPVATPWFAASPGPAAALKQAVEARLAGNDQLKNMMHGIIDRAKGEEDKVRKELSSWFDHSMDRVSGSYKRWSQAWAFIFAFLLAILLNISAIDIVQSLWQRPIDTKFIAEIKENPNVSDVLNELHTLPIGWPIVADTTPATTMSIGTFFRRSPWCWDWTRISGWIITALATLFGAPFWFDTLQQFVRLKGTGPSPAEKKANTGAAA